MKIRSTVLALLIGGVISCDSVPTSPNEVATPVISKRTSDVVYTSGTNVTAWDPILQTPQYGDWETRICTNSPAVGRNAAWQNPHNAYVLSGHPWAYGSYGFTAPWINSWNYLASTGSGNPDPGMNWTKYQTTVTGNGSFVIRLLADNCSWIYLDGTLVGVQGTNLYANSYGLTLNGTHTLEFIIFDGGGAAGGMFVLETTTNPPPPLNPDLDSDGVPNDHDNCPLAANADQADLDGDGAGDVCDADMDGDGHNNDVDAYPRDSTRWQLDNTAPVITPTVTGTLGAGGWYTSNINVSWDVQDNETPITSEPCTSSLVSTDTGDVSFSCTATSGGGTDTKSVTVKRDASTPTVTPVFTGTNFNGWYTSDAAISWSVTGNGPSGATASCPVVSQTTDIGNITFTCTGTSGAGVPSTGSTTIRRDATSPTIGYTGNAGTYTLDQTVAITCSFGDAMSGIASQTCANVNGAAYTFVLGAHTYSAKAIDNAGNTSTASTTFTVRATNASLCTMTRLFVTGPGENGIENSLCTKLEKRNYAPYINEVKAQSGKSITVANAALLVQWAQSLL